MEAGSLDNIYGLGGYRWGYRDKARIIAIIDVVSSTLNLGNTFLQFLAVSAFSAWVNSVDPDQSKIWIDMNQNRRNLDGDQINGPKEIIFTPHTFKKLAWIFVLAHFAIHFSQLIFAINLYTGTARTTPAKAHAACRLWFVTSSILLGILGIKIFFHPRDSNVIYNMLEIVFRAVGMYIVGEYAKEIKRDGIGPRPPPVYFSSHVGTSGGHHRRHGSRGLVGAYSLQPPVPVYFSPHMHYESPPKYEEIMRQSAAEAAAVVIGPADTVVQIPETAGSSSTDGAVAIGVAIPDGVSSLAASASTANTTRLPSYEEIVEQGPSVPPVSRPKPRPSAPSSPVKPSDPTLSQPSHAEPISPADSSQADDDTDNAEAKPDAVSNVEPGNPSPQASQNEESQPPKESKKNAEDNDT